MQGDKQQLNIQANKCVFWDCLISAGVCFSGDPPALEALSRLSVRGALGGAGPRGHMLSVPSALQRLLLDTHTAEEEQ